MAFTKQEWKGYAFALFGTVAFSSLYVFSKAGLNETTFVQFGLYYFGIGFLLNLLFSGFTGKIKALRQTPRSTYRLLFLLGVIDIVSNFAFFMSIQAIPDPSVTSFLGNLFPVFLIVLSFFLLKERFSVLEAIGAVIAISGAFTVSYTGSFEIEKFLIPGTGWVIINTFLAALIGIIARKNTSKASPEIFNLNSNGWIFLFFLVYFFSSKESVHISARAFQNIALASFFGAFAALLSFFYSYRFIPASRSSIVQSLKGIFVLAIAFLYFGKLPEPIQLIGGGISVSGVLLMTISQAGLISFGRK
jgi:drug/metabolite transporter (DMT)-like permease